MNAKYFDIFSEYGDLDDCNEQVMLPDPPRWMDKHTCRCGSRLASKSDEPIDIVYRWCPKSPTSPSSTAVVIYRPVLEMIVSHDPAFTGVVGDVYTKSGAKCVDFVSVFDPTTRHLPLRGGPGSKYVRCGDCGFVFLKSPGSSGVQPGLPLAYLDGRMSFIQSGRLFLTVHESIAEEVKKLNIDNLEVEEVPVFDIPPDNTRLPDDPDWSQFAPDFGREPTAILESWG